MKSIAKEMKAELDPEHNVLTKAAKRKDEAMRSLIKKLKNKVPAWVAKAYPVSQHAHASSICESVRMMLVRWSLCSFIRQLS
jgi:hypothetical protein